MKVMALKQTSTLANNPEQVSEPVTWFYARVSTSETARKQNLDLQLDCARQLGIPKSHVVTERGSGSRADRPLQRELLQQAQNGDTIYCYSVSRWSRNSRHLHETVEEMTERGIVFKSATEPTISTDSAASRMLLGLLGVLAAWEVETLRERTRDGLAAARARGRFGGRPPALDAKQRQAARDLRAAGMSVQKVADTLGVCRATALKAIREGVAA
jgi:DNA invertase Pin-like site-specific DNA recombinase